MEDTLQKLSAELSDLLKWKAEDERQQITVTNFGALSKGIVQKNNLVFTGRMYDGSALSYPYSLEVNLNGKIYIIPVEVII